ncbi:peptidoglycan editing factor PgeF [Methylococcus geothermalis]|uniref:Purine nucleoside phosphorylase n=1 Tax=Methylococcus geothermalis TaxID=2681310 RepID=A0A858Q8I1_9GAMM|nr:peptidoglycan editing factor PgeF [Methylococcus geothermalis]QJD30016.1 peptidoglycan editing factor PgeF [Methylococcus geothermalis]
MTFWIEPDWPAPPGVRAASTLRRGGTSVGAYAGLNLGAHVGDAPEAVAANRAFLRRRLDLPAEPAWLRQVHGSDAVEAGVEPEPAADASYTRDVGVVCAVMTADCLPVLLCTRDGKGVAAVHAGWRGLAGGVIERAADALGSGGLLAWLGPAIGPAAFEVGEEVRAAFLAQDAESDAAFRGGDNGRWFADIYLLARLRLRRLGIGDVHGGRWCTYSDENRFFSYRRDGVTGRMATLIWRDR